MTLPYLVLLFQLDYIQGGTKNYFDIASEPQGKKQYVGISGSEVYEAILLIKRSGNQNIVGSIIRMLVRACLVAYVKNGIVSSGSRGAWTTRLEPCH